MTRMAEDAWFAVRTVVAEMENRPWGPDDLGPGEIDYEERITLWRAPSVDAAIAYAEAEATQYVEDVGGVNEFLVDEFRGQAARSVVRVKTMSVTKRRKDSFSTNCL